MLYYVHSKTEGGDNIKIKVIDSRMGSGKTEMAIKMITSNKNSNFIYITPFLDEIKRVKESTASKHRMYEPVYRGGKSKHDSLHKLLSEGKSICSTHALFQKSNDITRAALKANNYVLILDEVMNVVEELQDFTKDDLNTIIETDNLAHIENDYLIWNEDKLNYNGRYNDIKSMALNKNLICINNRLMFWNFPIDIFDYFKEVYIMTYQFDCQIQRYYYDFHSVQYEKYQMENWEMVEYNKEREYEQISEIADLIHIYDGKMNSIGEDKYALSLSWFERDDENKTLQTILKNNLSNWFNNINRGVPAKKRLWTSFKSYKHTLKGKGYTNRFIPLNARSTNDFRETEVVAYCSNRFIRPNIIHFFYNRDISLNQDEYALSEMLQWIWRSRIRDRKSIELYIPSKRMRDLLIDFLQPKVEN